MDAAVLLTRLTTALDDRDWAALPPLLGDGFAATFVHTGERFDADGYVGFQAGYPGAWRVAVADLVADGDRAVARAVVTDAAGSGETYHVAMFATARSGLLVDLVEVWADGAASRH